MSVVYPSPEKIRLLRERWMGQEQRLRRVAHAMLAGEDWTRHLFGLPFVEEIPPQDGDALGRDLRGADLRRFLHPEVEVRPAWEREAALVAGIAYEATRTNTPLPGTSPFPTDTENAEGAALAMRRGVTFLLARSNGIPVGTVRVAARREFRDLTSHRPYAEISGLAVLPAFRRNGIGGRLLAEAEKKARGEAHGWALLRTTYEMGLVPWYERLGWETRRMRQLSYANAPAFLDVVLTKRLVPTVQRPSVRRPARSLTTAG